MTPETRAAVLADLSGNTRVVFDMLAAGDPVTVGEIFDRVNRTPGIYDLRAQQQRIGGTITLLNRRLEAEGLRAVPGEPRGTYRIRPRMN